MFDAFGNPLPRKAWGGQIKKKKQTSKEQLVKAVEGGLVSGTPGSGETHGCSDRGARSMQRGPRTEITGQGVKGGESEVWRGE